MIGITAVIATLLLALLATPASAQQAPANSDAPKTLEPIPCENRPGEGPEMVLIAPGRFWMGSADAEAGRDNDEGPRHEVTIVRPFALARCETTRGEFRKFIDETGYETDAERGGGCYATDAEGKKYEQQKTANWRDPGFPQTDLHPVVCVSWNDARVYARWLSLRTGQTYRLPTEAEWEYAARAGSTQSRFWGDDPNAACDYANGADRSAAAKFANWTVADCDDKIVFTAASGSYRRNAWGLSDMLGNVWEWTEDCWHDTYAGAPDDGSAWREANSSDCARRVLRGGSWNFVPLYLRSADRYRFNVDGANDVVGIRLARTP